MDADKFFILHKVLTVSADINPCMSHLVLYFSGALRLQVVREEYCIVVYLLHSTVQDVHVKIALGLYYLLLVELLQTRQVKALSHKLEHCYYLWDFYVLCFERVYVFLD